MWGYQAHTKICLQTTRVDPGVLGSNAAEFDSVRYLDEKGQVPEALMEGLEDGHMSFEYRMDGVCAPGGVYQK